MVKKLSIFMFFLICFAVVLFPDTDKTPSVITTAEAAISDLSEIREFFLERKDLFEEVHNIFISHAFHWVSGMGSNITVTLEDGSRESLTDTNLFDAEEKSRIASLFSDDRVLTEYCANQFFVHSESVSDSTVVDIRITYVDDSKVSNVANSTYYMEELSDNWFVCVVIKLSVVRIDLDKYKMQRPDKGLVLLED